MGQSSPRGPERTALHVGLWCRVSELQCVAEFVLFCSVDEAGSAQNVQLPSDNNALLLTSSSGFYAFMLLNYLVGEMRYKG